jgi:hypothetical protein
VHRTAHKLCYHCQGRLPLLRALIRAEFCTAAHEMEYRRLIEDLGLERLKKAAERLRIDPETVEVPAEPVTVS